MRYGWVLFETEEDCTLALNSMTHPQAGGVTLNVVKSKAQKKFVKIASPFDKSKLETHLKLSADLIKCLDKEKEIQENPLLD